MFRSAWYYFCVWIGKEFKMITGYGDGQFRPEQNISRAEAAAILLRQSKIELQKTPNVEFFDVPDYAWYKDYVYTAVKIGLIPSHSGFVFPDQEITRGEFAFMANTLLNIQDCREVDSDKDGMPDTWEMKNNLDPLVAADARGDNDRDGLTALDEFQKGTDPNNSDTDGDGLNDKTDPDPARKPGLPVKPPVIPKKPATPPVTSFPPGVQPSHNECPYRDNPNQNNLDKDAFIDGCDIDLDNDGIFNALGIYGPDGLIDPDKLAESRDNCVFAVNPDQQDSDTNGVGNACESTEDLCPGIPEDLDGVEDGDGCPEVVDQTPVTPPGVYINHGPACYLLDYMADLFPGDKVFTAITDLTTHETIFAKSEEVTY
ncbi:MAG: S-layer homology domain-containing protein, partial [Candidatus Diapherotrites archaeon]|nr:S-layer homology domain-containing protein [Candidatus Diapherotrites archaeon]